MALWSDTRIASNISKQWGSILDGWSGGLVIQDLLHVCIHSLNGDLPLGGWSTVRELNGTPEPMEFRTLINTHYSIYRDWALPHLGREREKGEREERGEDGGERGEGRKGGSIIH